MANLDSNIDIDPIGPKFREINTPVDGGAHLFRGGLVSQLTATGMLCQGGTASSGPAVGVAGHEQDNSAGADAAERCMIQTDGIFVFPNAAGGDACSEATTLYSVVYMYDDHTIADNSAGSTRQPAGLFMGMEEDGRVRVYVGWRLGAAADAASIALADAGAFTTATNIEAALAEIYQDLKSTLAMVPISLASFVDADGDPLAKFVSAASPTFGFNLGDSEAFALRWNNDATPGTALCQVSLPADLDDTADMYLEFLASKSGATVGDATTLTCTAFILSEGDLHDADANAGGTTNALVGNAVAKTTDELRLTITAANVPANAYSLTFTVTPTAGTLGTDDLLIHAARLRYKRKLRAS